MDPRVEAARTVLVENGQLGVPRYVVREALAAADAVGGQPPIVLTDEERERVVRLLSSPVAPGPTKTLDETILRKLSADAAGDRPDAACSDPNCSYRAEVEAGYYVRADAVGDRPVETRWENGRRIVRELGAVQSPGQGEDPPGALLTPEGFRRRLLTDAEFRYAYEQGRAEAGAVGDRDRNEFQEGADLYQRGYEDALRESPGQGEDEHQSLPYREEDDVVPVVDVSPGQGEDRLSPDAMVGMNDTALIAYRSLEAEVTRLRARCDELTEALQAIQGVLDDQRKWPSSFDALEGIRMVVRANLAVAGDTVDEH